MCSNGDSLSDQTVDVVLAHPQFGLKESHFIPPHQHGTNTSSSKNSEVWMDFMHALDLDITSTVVAPTQTWWQRLVIELVASTALDRSHEPYGTVRAVPSNRWAR